MARRLGTPLALGGAAAALVVGAAAGRSLLQEFGASRRRLAARAARSALAAGDLFVNRLPTSATLQASPSAVARAMLARGKAGKPGRPVPVRADPQPEQAGELAATWLGHASALIEVDGYRILADPVWRERVSPSQLVGPRRMHPVPATSSALPALDAVLISHDHYDHLDLGTIRQLLRTQDAPFCVPAGVGEHLRRWGVPDERIVELEWDQRHQIGELSVTCTEARHFSGRLFRRNPTLWSSWALSGPRHRVFFGGDTGATDAFAGIGERYGPFDLTLLPIGAYHQWWPDIHMTPEEAVAAHRDLRGGVLLPIHWATFDLAFHSWAEPPERLIAAAGAGRADADGADPVRLALPVPGARIDLTAEVPDTPWW